VVVAVIQGATAAVTVAVGGVVTGREKQAVVVERMRRACASVV
jgi:hypothetical protein